MGEIILPPALMIARATVRYLDATGAMVNPYTGVVRTASLGGDRIGCSVEFTPLASLDASDRTSIGVLRGYLSRLRGKQNRTYLTDNTGRRRGAFPTGELLTNNAFASSTSGWSVSGELTLTGSDRVLRAARTAVTSTQTIRATAATVVSGATYAARVFVNAGRGPINVRLRLGTTAGGSEIAAQGADVTTEGLQTLVGIASGTTMHFSILDGTAGGRAAGDFQDIHYTSLSRCATASGTAAAGASAMLLTSMPASLNDALLTGDLIEVITARGSELKFLESPVNTDGSGNAYVRFNPPLRGSVANGAAVIIHNPLSRFISVSAVPEWAVDSGVIMRANMDFEESPL